MGMRIKQLPPLIANQIAAGEVIERPASVVKELLENALDAGADTIAIEVAYGGLNQIKISDNGAGIVAADLPLAIAAHATSKIKALNDLYAIESMGFRGEALASIASIAKVTLSSKPAEQETAMMMQVQGVEMNICPCARTVGTTVDVIDLFFNAPVRKRFLKSEKLEFQAIEAVVKRFALAAPRIALTLKHNGKQILSLPAATNEETQLMRLRRILGSAFVKEAIYLDVDHGTMKLCGWISGPHFQRSQNDKLWVYINRRMVKDKLIQHALKQSYDGILYPGRFPACVLYLTINHDEVDVNVHPTKHEVRFQQPRLVFDFFTSQLTAALESMQVNNEVSLDLFSNATGEKNCFADAVFESSCTREYTSVASPGLPLTTYSAAGLGRDLMETPWFTLNNKYVLAFIRQQPYIVNIIALQHYSVQEQLVQLDFPLASRPLLVPVRHSFPQHFKNNPSDLTQCLNRLGVHLEWVSGTEALIRTIPLCLPYLDLRLFLEALEGLESMQQQHVLELMTQSQVFDPELLSQEEKMELNELLLRMEGEDNKIKGVFKPLTPEDCWNLLHD